MRVQHILPGAGRMERCRAFQPPMAGASSSPAAEGALDLPRNVSLFWHLYGRHQLLTDAAP